MVDTSNMTSDQRKDLLKQLQGDSFWSRLTIPPAVKRLWRLVGNPFLGLIGVSAVLFFLVDAAVRADLYLAATRLFGAVCVVLTSVLVILVACYTFFDPFLSFREFGKLLRKWESGAGLTQDDREMGRSMAIRSGLVFLSICILLASALHFIQPAVKAATAVG